ncbi:uncharacterized protein LOC144209100 isoform X2 [Stigmatopora nigra]
MYARTNTGSSHGDFTDRNGVNYVSSTESFGHCSQLFWKKDPHDSSSTINWCDQLPSSSAALSNASISSAALSGSSLSLESRQPGPATSATDDMDSDERPYVCDLCSCAYKHASSLLNHKLTHKTGDFRCDFCSKPYTNYMSLRNHMRIHGQKRYMCDRCGKAFRLARYLRNHQRIHDDGPNRFDCPSCSKSYRTMLELAQHRCSAATSTQGRASTVSPQNSQPSMRSSTSSKHISSSTTATSSYSLLQPLVPEVKEMNLGYTRLSANLMVGKKTSIGYMLISSFSMSCLLKERGNLCIINGKIYYQPGYIW